MKHTFAICAYKNSPFLEGCIKSIINQSVKSDVIICTSTPNVYIDEIAAKYEIDVFVNEVSAGISSDWNFAYEKASTNLVTIAHQDDIYLKDYAKTVLKMKEKYPDMSLFCSSSVTAKGGKLIQFGMIELIKKFLRTPLRIRALNDKTFIKLMPLRFGNPIICPSCAYSKELCGENLFVSNLSFALDWEVLVKLAKKEGRFIVSEKPLIIYRVHDESETKAALMDDRRSKEESEMFDRLLPKFLSNIIKKAYRSSYDAYTK